MLAAVFTVWAVGAYGLLFAWARQADTSRELALRVLLSIGWPLVLLTLTWAVLVDVEEPAS